MEAEVHAVIDDDPALWQKFAILTSIPNVGAITAVMRKMVILANTLIAVDRCWQAESPTA